MNVLGAMPAPLPFPMQVVLVATVMAGGVTDLLTRRIPNWITVPAACTALVLQGYYGGLRGVALSMVAAALGFAIFLALYLAGGMGAGDVKLFAAVGAFVGPQMLVLVFILTGLLGGIMAVGVALARGRLRRTLMHTGLILLNFGLLRWQEVRRSSSLDAPGALRLPYGAVIALGTLLSLWYQSLSQSM